MKSTFFLPLGLIVFLLSACISDDKITPIEPYYVFHDNSSKVWLIDYCIKNGKNYAPMSLKYKEIITFHESRNCYIQKMNTFGDEPGKMGTFSVNGANKTVSIKFKDRFWKFSLKYFSHRKMILVPLNKTCEYTLELIPVPEPA